MKKSSRRPLGATFSALLTATFVTNLGDGLRLAALPLLATTLTTSPLLISSITAAQYLPWATFAPFGGVIVDRADRRRLIMTTQTWRAAVMALLAVMIITDAIAIWHLAIVAFVITAGEILVDPSVVATVPTLVDPEDLDRANSRINSVEVVTNEFAGGPLGAFSFGLAPWLPFVIDAVSYLGSVAPFSRLPRRPAKPLSSARPDRSVRNEIGVGVRWIMQHRFLRPLTASVAVFHLGTAGAFSLLVVLVTDELEASEIVFGITLAAAALGATAASLVASRLTERFSRRNVFAAGAGLTAVSVLIAAAVTESWQLVAVWVLNGLGAGIFHSIGRGFIQRHTPNDRLGRTAIASRMITRSSFVVGALLAGAIAAAASVRWSFAIAGTLHLAGTASLWRSFRHQPDPAG